MDTDRAMQSLGKYSRYQLQGYFLVSLAINFPFAWIAMAVVFVGEQAYAHLIRASLSLRPLSVGPNHAHANGVSMEHFPGMPLGTTDAPFQAIQTCFQFATHSQSTSRKLQISKRGVGLSPASHQERLIESNMTLAKRLLSGQKNSPFKLRVWCSLRAISQSRLLAISQSLSRNFGISFGCNFLSRMRTCNETRLRANEIVAK